MLARRGKKKADLKVGAWVSGVFKVGLLRHLSKIGRQLHGGIFSSTCKEIRGIYLHAYKSLNFLITISVLQNTFYRGWSIGT